MPSSTIDPNLIAKLSDPEVQAQLMKLITVSEAAAESSYSPFYKNVHGKYTAGHANLEKYKVDLGLTPISEAEAIALGLMEDTTTPPDGGTTDGGDTTTGGDGTTDGGDTTTGGDGTTEGGDGTTTVQATSLNEPTEDELKSLRMQAKAAGIPNWQVKGAARLRGELTKLQLKAESEANDTGSDNS